MSHKILNCIFTAHFVQDRKETQRKAIFLFAGDNSAKKNLEAFGRLPTDSHFPKGMPLLYFASAKCNVPLQFLAASSLFPEGMPSTDKEALCDLGRKIAISLRARDLINHRSVFWERNRSFSVTSGLQPNRFRFLDFAKCLFGCITVGRASIQIWNISNISTILFGIEDVDMVIFHLFSFKLRLLCSINFRNWRT